jgi:hypothetical protein
MISINNTIGASSNQTSPILAEDLSCPHVALLSVLNNYIVPAVSVLGVFTNTYCIVVFGLIIKHEQQNGHMFKYLLMKAVHDDIQFIIQSFSPLYYCTTCSTYNTYASQVWYIGFYFYVECVNELSSGFFEIAAAFDCWISIKGKLAYCKRQLVFYAVSAAISVYTVLFYIFFIFNFEIVRKSRVEGAQNVSYYVYEYTDFSRSETNVVFRFMHGFTRDAFALIAILLLNLLILLTMKKTIKKKRELNGHMTVNKADLAVIPSRATFSTASSKTRNGGESKTTNGSKSEESASSAERNIKIMLVASGVNYFFGHVFMFVSYCVLIKPSVFRTCFFNMTLVFFYASYMTPFFIYFACNKLFRSYALGMRKRIDRVNTTSRSVARSHASRKVESKF